MALYAQHAATLTAAAAAVSQQGYADAQQQQSYGVQLTQQQQQEQLQRQLLQQQLLQQQQQQLQQHLQQQQLQQQWQQQQQLQQQQLQQQQLQQQQLQQQQLQQQQLHQQRLEQQQLLQQQQLQLQQQQLQQQPQQQQQQQQPQQQPQQQQQQMTAQQALQAAQQQPQQQQQLLIQQQHQQMLQQQLWQQQQQQLAQARGAQPAVASDGRLFVTGGQNPTVGNIVRGDYVPFSENHGRPVYKRSQQASVTSPQGGVNMLDVLIYYWDDRDGPTFCGWWFGPRVGGDQVWAYSQDQSMVPPATQWKVPYDGPVDSTFIVSSANAGNLSMDPAYQADWRRQQAEEERQRQLQLQQQQQADEARRRDEERRWQDMERRRIEQEQQQQEQIAVNNIRRLTNRMRFIDEEGFGSLRMELEQTLAVEGPRCGSMHRSMVEEVHQTIEQAIDRFRAEAERRVEDERRRREREELCGVLVQELLKLITYAETKIDVLKVKAAPFLLNGGLPAEYDLEKTYNEVAVAQLQAEATCKACTDFLVNRRSHLEDIKAGSEDLKMQLVPLQFRIHRLVEVIGHQGSPAYRKGLTAVRRKQALQTLEKRKTMFAKYDQDGDGVLNREELKAYAQTQLGFVLEEALLERIMKLHSDASQKGVPPELLFRARATIGVAREAVAMKARRERAARRRAEVAARKAQIQQQILQSSSLVDASGKAVAEAEAALQGLPEEVKKLLDENLGEDSSRVLTCASELHALVDKAEAASATARGQVARAKVEVSAVCQEEELGQEDEGEMKELIRVEAIPLANRCSQLSDRLAKAQQMATSLRQLAGKKDLADLDQCRSALRSQLRRYVQKVGQSLEEVFQEVDKDGDGAVSEADLLAFLFSGEDLPERVDSERTGRLCAEIAEAGAKTLTKEEFRLLVQAYYKVCKGTVLTSSLVIKDGKTLSRLEEGSILVSELDPQEEERTKVTRVFCRTMKDTIEGWCSICGNQGTQFLELGGDLFKVARNVSLTKHLELKEADVVRDLEEGEVLQVIKWETKEPSNGTPRMKVRARLDGAVGWVSVTNAEELVNLRVV